MPFVPGIKWPSALQLSSKSALRRATLGESGEQPRCRLQLPLTTGALGTGEIIAADIVVCFSMLGKYVGVTSECTHRRGAIGWMQVYRLGVQMRVQSYYLPILAEGNERRVNQ